MTTILAYNRQGEIDYSRLEFDPDKPDPLPDGMFQNPVLRQLGWALELRFGGRPDFFYDSNTFICYDRLNLNGRVAPDFYAAFGVDAEAIIERRLYLPWEAGKPPDFVLEVASRDTAMRDVGAKREIYAQIGIPEYWRFDRTGGDLYGEPLAGELLVDGIYRPMELTTSPDGVLKGYSPVLGLHLCWYDGVIYVYDGDSGTYFRTLQQMQADLDEAEAARMDAEAARMNAEAARMDAEAARESDQARIRQLEEELRKRESEG